MKGFLCQVLCVLLGHSVPALPLLVTLLPRGVPLHAMVGHRGPFSLPLGAIKH